MPELIQQLKSRSIQWNIVLKTDNDFLSMTWILVASIKFRMWNCPFLWRETKNISFAKLKIFHKIILKFYYGFNEHNSMYEKKNKICQADSILEKVSVTLSDAVHRNMKEKSTIFP